MTRKAPIAAPGSYIVLGRKDDTDEVVHDIVDDIEPGSKTKALCRRALLQQGLNDPFSYEFLAMFYCHPRGGSQLVLDQQTLRRYVKANYG